MTLLRSGAALAGVAAGAHLLPSIATIPAVHRRLLPGLSGIVSGAHVALTFDDGPDPESTPAFLDVLADLDTRATFFVLGSQLAAHPDVGRRIVDAGHEIAVHGWLHRPHLLRLPWQVPGDVARTVRCIERTCATTPRFWRPPNGVISGAGLLAARRHRLIPVLWTADGHDWQADATAASIVQRVRAHLRPGGVVLLHDSDITSAPGSWRAAVQAVPQLVRHCREQGWAIGPLREHY